ncbi:hypothetical protein AN639_12370 [Candidatus Epulonipiscium fishelsonii]|uniref:Uncharacterized protein n=1 Tax=Candidatus Epulonipiscium fishelsonii TaxID=77094 RepID=A0ACC8XC60_9FIRM|nr:hypothetical protein AN396_01135 [Epulopiscium sp. SCG-B11WGA-EpuloA1]ONI42364.1 hypothetical protein AN639_12520 [Epulopiscium sp. SCG-B05WGA-EpuloA1]ONI42449.1 hypothetical protein AN639_12370 [Epulopiscium sp. SCG-B05WGA-EpuloA1]
MNFKQLSLLIVSGSMFANPITSASPTMTFDEKTTILDSETEEYISIKQEIVEIPDKSLRKIVLSLVDKNIDGKIQKDEIEKLTSLYADNLNINNLKGLEYAINLENLSLNDNNISDISTIHSFKKLKILRLNNNPIDFGTKSNIEVLEKFKIAVPKEMNKSIINFKDENLKKTVLSNLNKASNDTITQNDMLKLEQLDLSNKSISYLDGLEYATNLQTLDLGSNNIKNIAPLSYLLKLKELDLSDNKIWDISSLSKLTNLENLNLRGNTPTQKNATDSIYSSTKTLGPLDSLKELICLEKLVLANNNIITFKALEELKNLKDLDISNNKVNNNSFWQLSREFWKQLENLNINYNYIYIYEDIEFQLNGERLRTIWELLVKLKGSYKHPLSQGNIPALKYDNIEYTEEIEITTSPYTKILLPIEFFSYTEKKDYINEYIIDEHGNIASKRVTYDNGNVISNVDTSRSMDYILKYIATDERGMKSNPLIINLKVTSAVNEKPIIQYNGNKEIVVYKGDNNFQTPPMLVAQDAEDGTLIAEANPAKVDTTKLGNHKITYIATDSNGNQSDPVEILIKVIELEKNIDYKTKSIKNQAPRLNFISNTYFEIIQNSKFEMPLVEGIDDHDDVDIHIKIFYNGVKVDKVDTSKLGEYKLIYLGVDNNGKTSDELILTFKVIKAVDENLKATHLNFIDISDHWAKDVVNKAVELGFVAGVSKDCFMPEKPVQIADAFTFLDRVLIFNNIAGDFSERNLTKIDAIVLDKIGWAIEHINSIGSKLSADTFNLIEENLENNMTREMLAQILFEITNGKLATINTNIDFIDISESLYKEAIKYCAKTGLLCGTSKNKISPDKILTRAELVAILIRLNEKLKS